MGSPNDPVWDPEVANMDRWFFRKRDPNAVDPNVCAVCGKWCGKTCEKAVPVVLTQYQPPITDWHYIGEDTKRAIMFDPARLEAERLARAEKYAAKKRSAR